MLLIAGPAAWHWAPVSAVNAGWALFAGGLGTLGLLGMTYAFTHLEASRVASLDYSGFVWAAAFGYFLFDEVPSATTWVAAALIIGGCSMLLRRD
jgi:drug/metabolite transporter (DMT)-like permease